MGQPSPHDHDIIGVSGFAETQIVDTGSGHVFSGMTPCDYTGQNVNPGSQLAAKKPVIAVEVLSKYQLNGFGLSSSIVLIPS